MVSARQNKWVSAFLPNFEAGDTRVVLAAVVVCSFNSGFDEGHVGTASGTNELEKFF
jgi:hypothetical protein